MIGLPTKKQSCTKQAVMLPGQGGVVGGSLVLLSGQGGVVGGTATRTGWSGGWYYYQDRVEWWVALEHRTGWSGAW